jgi:hypothetical protein
MVLGCWITGAIAEDRIDVLGKWTIWKGTCSDCRQRQYDEVGKQIDFRRDAIKNPIYGDCDKNPSFSAFIRTDRNVIAREYRIDTKWLDQVVPKAKDFFSGHATCDGLNYMPLIFADGKLIYIYEGGLVFALRRN